MDPLRPFLLAARQRDLDRAATARFPQLYERKRQRMLPSPHAFFRGSARLFHEILAARPDLAGGPPGDGWIVGDMHLENAGAYRTDADRVVFDLNDFDDATVGPMRLDVLRLATSVLLAGRSFRASGAESIALAQAAVSAYLEAAAGGAPGPRQQPAPIAAMMSRAAARSRKELLDGRAPADRSGRRRFLRGERYVDLPEPIAANVPSLVAAYVGALGARAPARATEWQVEDAAMRIAGTGSLGTTRIAALVRDRGGEGRIIELKEARTPAVTALLAAPTEGPANAESRPTSDGPANAESRPTLTDLWVSQAERVVGGARALADDPPRQLAAVASGEMSFAARKLFPQEDKLRIDTLHTGPKLDAVVQCIGRVLGAAHARAAARSRARGGAADAPGGWAPSDAAAVVDHAIEMAGVFEAVYLAYTRG